MLDGYGRELDHLRISVTDRCNMHCSYCRPANFCPSGPKNHLLSFDEITQIVSVLVQRSGITHLRLTGGEPLLREDLPRLVTQLRRLAITDLAMTTNAVLLKSQAQRLRPAGLTRLNISLDSLRQETLTRISPGTRLQDILDGITAARLAGFAGTKFNAVLMRGVNDDEIIDLIRFANTAGGRMRFIELMPVGVMAGRHEQFLVTAEQVRAVVRSRFAIREEPRAPGAPEQKYQLTDRRTGEQLHFGLIASETEPFCRSCRRLRLTAQGKFISCLFREDGVDLRTWVRTSYPNEAAAAAIFDQLVGQAAAQKPIRRLPMVKHAMAVVGG